MPPRSCRRLQALTFLSLASTAIGDAGLTAVSPHLKSLRRLRHLSLADAGLTAAAAKPLLLAMPAMSALQHLNLSRNAFDVCGHVALAPLLAALPGLRFLDNIGARFTARSYSPPTILPPNLSALEHLGLQVRPASLHPYPLLPPFTRHTPAPHQSSAAPPVAGAPGAIALLRTRELLMHRYSQPRASQPGVVRLHCCGASADRAGRGPRARSGTPSADWGAASQAEGGGAELQRALAQHTQRQTGGRQAQLAALTATVATTLCRMVALVAIRCPSPRLRTSQELHA